jgi:hypothetical protein
MKAVLESGATCSDSDVKRISPLGFEPRWKRIVAAVVSRPLQVPTFRTEFGQERPDMQWDTKHETAYCLFALHLIPGFNPKDDGSCTPGTESVKIFSRFLFGPGVPPVE